MASSLVIINAHLIFHVKSTGITMRPNDLPRIFQYMGGIIKRLGGIPIEIGGVTNHVHILTSLPKSMALADFVRDVKSNSSKWIKQIDAHYARFSWQDGYGAFSVSPSLLDKTINYIRGQEEHHRKRCFKDEYKLFLEHYGIDGCCCVTGACAPAYNRVAPSGPFCQRFFIFSSKSKKMRSETL